MNLIAEDSPQFTQILTLEFGRQTGEEQGEDVSPVTLQPALVSFNLFSGVQEDFSIVFCSHLAEELLGISAVVWQRLCSGSFKLMQGQQLFGGS